MPFNKETKLETIYLLPPQKMTDFGIELINKDWHIVKPNNRTF